MRDRIGALRGAITANTEPTTCTSCGGSGGRTEAGVDASGVYRENWVACSTCGGAGVR